MVSLNSILGRSCHRLDRVIAGTNPSRMEWIECYYCVISKRYNMWCGQSVWGRMSKHSAQIQNCSVIIWFSVFLVNAFLCPSKYYLCVFWLWSLGCIWPKLHHSWYLFTYVYDRRRQWHPTPGVWWAAIYGVTRVGHDWATSLSLFTFMHWRRKWQPTPVFLPGESQGRGSLVGCRLWGRTESDTTEAT